MHQLAPPSTMRHNHPRSSDATPLAQCAHHREHPHRRRNPPTYAVLGHLSRQLAREGTALARPRVLQGHLVAIGQRRRGRHRVHRRRGDDDLDGPASHPRARLLPRAAQRRDAVLGAVALPVAADKEGASHGGGEGGGVEGACGKRKKKCSVGEKRSERWGFEDGGARMGVGRGTRELTARRRDGGGDHADAAGNVVEGGCQRRCDRGQGGRGARSVNRRGGHPARARLSHTRLRRGQPPFPSLVETPSGLSMRPGGIFGTVSRRIVQATGTMALTEARHWLDHTHVAADECDTRKR